MLEATEDAGFEQPQRTGPRPSADADAQIETTDIEFEDEAACEAILRLMDAYSREHRAQTPDPALRDHPRARVLLAWNGQVHAGLAV